jgi:O-6-methylguanine DNA methyltransferase
MVVYYNYEQINNNKYLFMSTDRGLIFIGSPNNDMREAQSYLKRIDSYSIVQSNTRLKQYSACLLAYLSNEIKTFDIELDVRVISNIWSIDMFDILNGILYGQLVSYTDIASRLGKDRAVRSVASCIAKNPVLFICPCHRVIRKDKKLGGYRAGLKLKEELLIMEGAVDFKSNL